MYRGRKFRIRIIRRAVVSLKLGLRSMLGLGIIRRGVINLQKGRAIIAK